MPVLRPGQGVLYMKVGLHAQETLEDIIARKQREFDEAGAIWWGYGGNTCHPIRHVQPFAMEQAELGNVVTLVMQKMESKHSADPKLAEEYSDDGLNWRPVPAGIRVLGSRYALVLGQLELDEFNVDFREFEVGVGPSRGRIAQHYIRGRVDKACFQYNGPAAGVEPDAVHQIGLFAPLVPPYAVILR